MLGGMGVIGTAVGILGAQISGHDITHSPAMIVGGLTAIIGGFWLSGCRVWKQPTPEGTNYEFREFLMMHQGGRRADMFIEAAYRPLFIARALESAR